MLKTITKDDIENHLQWLRRESDGKRIVTEPFADLSGADLSGANLRGAEWNMYTAFYHLQCPETGSFIAWKKCRYGVVAKLKIPARAKRSNATSRKCRAEYADVLRVYGGEIGISIHDSDTVYMKGKRVHCDSWNDDRWPECGGGIHFFMTRGEAEQWNG